MPAIGTGAVDTRALATVMHDERMRSVPAIEIPVPPLEPRTTR